MECRKVSGAAEGRLRKWRQLPISQPHRDRDVQSEPASGVSALDPPAGLESGDSLGDRSPKRPPRGPKKPPRGLQD
eukprot:3287878-Pyramimonas_sp.AAC.1